MVAVAKSSGIGRYGARFFIGALVVATEAIFLYFQHQAGIELVLASLLTTLALLFQLSFGLWQEAPTPADQTVLMFNWMFLDLAPKMQLLDNPVRLVNTSTVHAIEVLHTNAICALFIVTFTAFYHFLRRDVRPGDLFESRQKTTEVPTYAAFGLSMALIMSALCTVLAGKFAYYGSNDIGSAPLSNIIGKVFLFFPTASLFIVLSESVRRTKPIVFSRVCVLVLLFLMVLATQSPLTEKRNTLGPVYLGLLLVAFDRTLRSQNRRLMLLTFGMVLIFPAISIYTHNDEPGRVAFDPSKMAELIKEHYTDINYDAWANIYTTIELVGRHGATLGHQLLGTLLFYVPRSLWHAKPIPTGAYIAHYLMANYTMWFDNLSAPLIAEGYVDFGILGIAAYAVILAAGVYSLNRLALLRQWNYFPITIYFAIYLMFVQRGALMPALAYGTGQFLSFLMATAVLSLGRRAPSKKTYTVAPAPGSG